MTDPELIYGAVSTDPDILTIGVTAARVNPVVLPDDPEFPAITYYLVSQPTDFTQDEDQYRTPRWRFKLWSLRYADLVPMAKAIAAIFGDRTRTPFGRSWIEYPTHAEDHDKDVHAYWRAIDVVVPYAAAGSASQ